MYILSDVYNQGQRMKTNLILGTKLIETIAEHDVALANQVKIFLTSEKARKLLRHLA